MKAIRQITVRDPSPELVDKLREVARARNQSMNTTILLLLEEALGVHHRRRRLERYATWTARDREEFDRALKEQRTVDEALWR
jgi:hypothetical protein